ncbi:uncharacterized protein L969DRAFT_87172 [Mixia osmundae IAM 14324]|uniref:eIF-2-alpha kinase activator GCN1 n=1 Tax=Mixia osmundae (strain CBS 9802 / IAM 14324 / JCM 22182 / KY 12970) TaxID=764103 RepID=G7E8G4_MIXOS|nr:uncharacterized protein L969DRAFT_87172 [Mixia osmundae IAM 14324]KEI39226.1 hypothetical protein L969DRAFT_87172 [Mixia osmundae IAM 14324]GAA99124.1 hypothetical protein E5Q_05814 [Mixia osmundae IAM 14324]
MSSGKLKIKKSERAEARDIAGWAGSQPDFSRLAGKPVDEIEMELDDAHPRVNGHSSPQDDTREEELDADELLSLAQRTLPSSRTAPRLAFIHEQLLPRLKRQGYSDLQERQALAPLVKLILQTYSRYADRASRHAVLDVLHVLVATDASVSDASPANLTSHIIGWLSKEVKTLASSPSSSAPTSLYTLAAWGFTILSSLETSQANSVELRSSAYPDLLPTVALAYHASQEGEGHQRQRTRVSTHHLAVRSLRSLRVQLPALLGALLANKQVYTLALLGLLCTVGADDPAFATTLQTRKQEIITLYTQLVLSSRTLPPQQTRIALCNTLNSIVTDIEMTEHVMPVADRMLLRSPEVALPVLEALFASAECPLDFMLSEKFLTAVLNQLRSIKEPLRNDGVKLVLTILPRLSQAKRQADLLALLLAPLRDGKTASAEHRVALYAILRDFTQTKQSSTTILQIIALVLLKESHEEALKMAMSCCSVHLGALLRSDSIDAALTNDLVKLQIDIKSSLRRYVLAGLAGALWQLDIDEPNAASLTLARALLPSLEVSLDGLIGQPASAGTNGPLEGYVAAALSLGLIARWLPDRSRMDNLARSLLNAGPRPSFLLSERVYTKLQDPTEAIWLARALLAVLLQSIPGQEPSQEKAISQLATYLALDSRCLEARRAILEATVTVDALQAPLLRGIEKRLQETDPDIGTTAHQSSRIRSAITALAGPRKAAHLAQNRRLVDLFLPSHHALCRTDRSILWIDLTLSIGQKPDQVISEHFDELIAHCLLGLASSASSTRDAAKSSLATLCLVCPGLAIPRLLQAAREDLKPESFSWIGPDELAIYETPSDVTFSDPLEKQRAQPIYAKGKDRELEQWDAELRASIAKKRATPVNLSKADQQLVQKRLAEEADVRARVVLHMDAARRGLAVIDSLVSSHTQEIAPHMPELVSATLAFANQAIAALLAMQGLATFLALADRCDDCTTNTRTALAMAVLRVARAKFVPEHYTHEPLNLLVTRTMYKLRFQAEQKPLSLGTFAFAHTLVRSIIACGGVAVDSEPKDEGYEQIALAIDLLGFQARECASPLFPRSAVLKDLLLALVSYPSLVQTASKALIDASHALENNASEAEMRLLLRGLLVEEDQLRLICLQAVQPLDLTIFDYSNELWLACQDEVERTRKLATELWEENGLDVSETAWADLKPFLKHEVKFVREAAARAVAAALALIPQDVLGIIQDLTSDYMFEKRDRLPEYDRFGMLIPESLNQEDPWQVRVAFALTVKHLAPQCQLKEIQAVFLLFISVQALGDKDDRVRSTMLEAAIAYIDCHHGQHLQELIGILEAYLAAQHPATRTDDDITEAIVILYGRAARHLDSTDPRVKQVMTRLIEALKTPSEMVQIAVSDCLPPLVKALRDDAPGLIDQLLRDVTYAARYAERRGAAYGLASAVKGRGISSLKDFSIMSRLRDAMDDKRNANSRQGVLFAYECFSAILGRIFEPYVIQLLPQLLSAFGDASVEVRQAAQDAARVIMGKLSGHAVKLILPTLLEGLNDKQWRSKKGAIELIGSMAFLAPKQLSASLPTIIPRLTEVLTDSHTQVRSAANTSLKRFGDVVTNPEVQAMQQILLAALVKPTEKTPEALDTLLATKFAHYLDHSALALIVPILERGLRERSAETKRKASQIVGNMATLTDSKDLAPYLTSLIPRVREVLIDPVPEARGTAAKALGSLVERLGEDAFPDLLPSLLETLRSDRGGVDQQGAAQGLSEILSGLGTERLDSILPEIIANTSSSRSYVREGFMSLLVFLPTTFGDRFTPFLNRIVQPVLAGLADDSELVRDASMRAGRMIVANHSTTAIDLLLPSLESSLFDSSWRIRQSSVQLVGELLFNISGISGKNEIEEEGEEDQHVGRESSRKALVDVLGRERRDRVLSAIYLARQDASGVVRQFATHVWKALVHNTPRTVREILPTLVNSIIKMMASNGTEQRETAARTVAELCRKLGEGYLGIIVEILQQRSQGDQASRRGACLTFAEVLTSATKAQLEPHEDEIIKSIRLSLVDADAVVRAAAAQCFDTLQKHVGAKAASQTIPTLLGAIASDSETAEAALAALIEIVQVRSSAVLPSIVPTLIKRPVSAANARALAEIAAVSGPSLNRRLPDIIDALASTKQDLSAEEAAYEVITDAIESVLRSVTDLEGLNILSAHLIGLAKAASPTSRASACGIFAVFCQVASVDYSDYAVDWIRQFISSFDDREPLVVDAAWNAMDALTRSTPKEDQEAYVIPLRRTIEVTGASGRDLPGFCRPNGLKAVLPILLQGLLNGTAEQREQAAYCLGDVTERTSAEFIKPYVTQITGPLIRIVAERFPPPVKSAILNTLTVLLARVPQLVRPFLPQLQRTFIKSVSDSVSSNIRSRAAQALGVLMAVQPRVDPVVTELLALASGQSEDIKLSAVSALASVTISGGNNVTQPVLARMIELVGEAFVEETKDAYNLVLGQLLGGLILHHPKEVLPFLDEHILQDPPTILGSMCLAAVIEVAPAQLHSFNTSMLIVNRVIRLAQVDQPAISRPARETRDHMRHLEPWKSDEGVQDKIK